MLTNDYSAWWDDTAPTNFVNGSCIAEERYSGFILRWRNSECNNFMQNKFYFCQKPTCE